MKHICSASQDCDNHKCSHRYEHDVQELKNGDYYCDTVSVCYHLKCNARCVNIDTIKRKSEVMDEKCLGCLGASVAHTCKGVIDKKHLAEKHTGMMISSSGLLGRIRDGVKVEQHNRYVVGIMLKQLEEMAKRFYAGDIKAVDEFLQLYCLDDDRPKET